jgi:hypothetical protein
LYHEFLLKIAGFNLNFLSKVRFMSVLLTKIAFIQQYSQYMKFVVILLEVSEMKDADEHSLCINRKGQQQFCYTLQIRTNNCFKVTCTAY